MKYRALDLHDFFNVAALTMDVRKKRIIVMKMKLCKTRSIEGISKMFAYKIMKKIGWKKLLNF